MTGALLGLLVATLPADGATEVPTNARVVVLRDAASPGLELRTAGGAAVAVTTVDGLTADGVVSIVTPAAELEAGVEYELVAGEERVAFTTGGAADTTAPVFEGAVGFIGDHRVAGCGETTYVATGELLKGPADEPVVYQLYRDRGGTLEPVGPPSFDTRYDIGLCLGGCDAVVLDVDDLGVGITGVFVLRAVDVAGNEDTNTATVAAAPSCPGIDFVDPPGDGGGGGCGVAEGARGGGAAGLVALLLLALTQRGKVRGHTRFPG